MMRFLSCLLIFLSVGIARAEIVDIRSGEHDDFTRLVFTLPSADTAWTLAGGNMDYTLRIETKSPEYEASTVFERIPRTRLEALVTRNGSPDVGLRLACPCEVEAFAFGVRSVVVDIRSPREEEVAEPNLPPTERPPVETVLRVSPAERAAVSRKWTGLDGFISEASRKREHRNQLVRAVARAASQGLVAPNVSLPPQERQEVPSETPRPAPPMQKERGQEDGPDNLRTETSYDKAFESVEDALPAESCLPDDLVDVASWKPGEDALAALSAGRATLIDEVGAVDAAAVISHAKGLLYQTFGAEARQVLALAPTSETSEVLFALSYVLDLEDDASSSIFAGAGDCLGKANVWAFLALGELPNAAQEKEILRTFSAMPAHLRRHLGPRLADRFLEHGKTVTADIVSAMIERVSDEADPASTLLRAKIGAEDGQEDRAEAALAEMVQKGERIAPEALISLVSLYEAREFAPTPDMVALLEAYALEHRRGPLGPGLRMAHAMGAALSGHFLKAFNVVREVEELDGTAAATELRSRVTGRLLGHADEASLLRFAIGKRLGSEARLERETSLLLAERLVSMGFAEPAANVLDTLPFHMTERERLLRARLALAQDRPRQAEAELLGIETDAAQRLRAEVRARAGDHGRAAETYEALGLETEAMRQTWLSGDWSRVQENGLPVEQRLARIVTDPSPEDPAIEGADAPLARNRAELARSAELRQVVEALLAENAAPEF